MGYWIILGISAACALLIFVLTQYQEMKDKTGKPTRNAIISLLLVFFIFFASLFTIYREQQSVKQSADDVKKILRTIERETFRLYPQDFTLRLFVTMSGVSQESKVERPIKITAKLGSALCLFELQNINTRIPSWGVRGGKPPLKQRFIAVNMTFFDLEKYAYLKDLNGNSFEFDFPYEEILPKPESISIEANLSIRGKWFQGTSDDMGKVIIPINFGEEK